MRFTTSEFETMVNEILYSTPVSFDMLCRIAEKTLKPTVLNWCKNEECLRGRGYEEDLMQEIKLRFIQTVVDYFLLRNGAGKPFNNDPEGFEDWMFKVAENRKRDFANRVRNDDFRTENIDDPTIGNVASNDDYVLFENEERIERLKSAFSQALSVKSSVYKVLTWVAQFILILDEDVTKIQSNDLILKRFEEKTLYDMYGMILNASKRTPWIVITKEQNDKILLELRKNRDGNVSFGETKYKDFFMKYNGVISGKKSVSDWTNRINDMIKKRLAKSSPDNQNNNTSDNTEDKKGARR